MLRRKKVNPMSAIITLLVLLGLLIAGMLGCSSSTEDDDSDSSTDSQNNTQGDRWPQPGMTWQWQLTGTINTSYDVDMYDIDLFDVSATTIQQLHDDGRIVICYFCAGSWEDWRSDADQFPDAVLGNELEGWPDEKWLDIRQLDELAPLMRARLEIAVQKGCDGVEPDNVDGYENNSGFPLSADDQLSYNRWLADEAHDRGLSIALKNDLDQIDELVSDFDWALNEQCFENDECEKLLPFIQAGKGVFGVEYELETSEFCSRANAWNFSWLRKNWDLDDWQEACQ